MASKKLYWTALIALTILIGILYVSTNVSAATYVRQWNYSFEDNDLLGGDLNSTTYYDDGHSGSAYLYRANRTDDKKRNGTSSLGMFLYSTGGIVNYVNKSVGGHYGYFSFYFYDNLTADINKDRALLVGIYKSVDTSDPNNLIMKFVKGGGGEYADYCGGNINNYCFTTLDNNHAETIYQSTEQSAGWHHVMLFINETKITVSIETAGIYNTTTVANPVGSPIYAFNFKGISGGGDYLYNLYIDDIVFERRIEVTTSLSNCSNGTRSVDFVIQDEVNNLNLSNSTMDIALQAWSFNPNQYNNFSFAFRGAHNYSLCIPSSTDSYFVDAIISYTSNGYVTRSYYLNNYSLTSTVSLVNLYLLSLSNSSNVIVNVFDGLGDPFAGIYVKSLRYFPETNSFKTVEISRTDAQGQSLNHLVAFDVWYQFVVQNKKEVFLITETNKVVVTPITLYINTRGSSLSTMQKVNNIANIIQYNNVTGTFTFTYSDLSNIVRTGCLEVVELVAGHNDVVCNNCVASTSATIICTLPNVNKTSSYVATGRIDTNTANSYGDIAQIFIRTGQQVWQSFRGTGNMATLMISGTSFFIGIFNPAVGIIFLLVGLFFSILMGWFTMVPENLILLGAIAVIILVRLKT